MQYFCFSQSLKLKRKSFHFLEPFWDTEDRMIRNIILFFFILAQGCNKKNKKYKVYLILFFVSIS